MSRPSDERHTPGPWRVMINPKYPKRIFVGYTNADGHDILVAQALIQNERANARLIAAAPDLLEALRLVAKGLRSKHIKDQTLIDSKSDGEEARMFTLSSVVFAAIAKAKGLAHREDDSSPAAGAGPYTG